jgi:hypothetical protein
MIQRLIRHWFLVLVTLVFQRMAEGDQAAVDKAAGKSMERWSTARAWEWYEKVTPIRGCNYLPRSAVNSTEMWQADTFDPKTIDQEFAWAKTLGYNSVRVFLQFIVWQQEPAAFKRRFAEFLKLAHRHRITVMPILFDDCAFAGREPYPGKQDDPVPGVHNSGWVPSPGLKRVVDRSGWPELERYVKDMVGTFAKDRRVLVWDLYNEPGNSGMDTKSRPLMEACFAWARVVSPTQPLTVAPWADFNSPFSRRMMELSDVVSLHAYDEPESVRNKLALCAGYQCPMLCTEWLRRQVGNSFASVAPLFAERKVGWYHWGLVAGRTQTYMPWGSKPGDPVPKVWQHDVLHPDGRPYDPEEVVLLRASAAKAKPVR